jgi:hypothetical protein
LRRNQAKIPTPSYTKLKWGLCKNLFIEGSFTGKAYRFMGYGTTQDVDDRDKNVFSIDGMKRVL